MDRCNVIVVGASAGGVSSLMELVAGLPEQARFRELFELSPEGQILTDREGVVRELNRGAAALFNLPGDYVLGKPLAVFIDPSDRRAFRVRLYRARHELAEEGWTVTLLPRYAEPIRGFLAVSPAFDARGAVTGLRWLVRDVSNQRAGAVMERTPAAVLRSAIDAMSTHIAVVDADARIVTTNSAWRDAERPAGLFTPTVVGTSYIDLCDAAIREGRGRRIGAVDRHSCPVGRRGACGGAVLGCRLGWAGVRRSRRGTVVHDARHEM